jgi:hypothetical protein
MPVSRSFIPEWTLKERVYALFAFAAAALAAYGIFHLGWIIYSSIWYCTGLVSLVVFFSALGLMARGIEAIKKERWWRAWEVYLGEGESQADIS